MIHNMEGVDIVTEILSLSNYSHEQYDPIHLQMRKNRSMAEGDQWSEEEKAKLRKEGRPLFTLNIIEPLVRQTVGNFIAQKISAKVLPANSDPDSATTAKIITAMLLEIDDDNDIEYKDTQFVFDAVIAGMGCMHLSVSFKHNPLGDIVIENENNLEIFLDPSARQTNQSDWTYVLRERWMTQQEITSRWPNKVESADFEVWGMNKWQGLIDRLPSNSLKDFPGEGDVNRGGRFKVFELYRRKEVVTYIWVHREDNTLSIPDNDELDDIFMVSNGFYKVKKISHKMVIDVILGFLDKVLDHLEQPYYYYPFAFYIPLQLGGNIIDFRSYVQGLEGVQQEKNRMRSVAQDILQKSANNNTLLPPGNEKVAGDMRLTGSKPGQKYVMDSGRPGDVIQLDAKLPVGLLTLAEKNDQDFVRISGQPPAMAGFQESPRETGVLFQSKVEQGIVGLRGMFDNFQRTKRLIAKIKLERIQHVYTEQREVQIVGEKDAQFTMINYPDVFGNILNNVTTGKYKISMEESALVKSERQAEFAKYQEIIKTFIPILKDVAPNVAFMIMAEMFRNSTIDKDQKIADMLEQTAGQMGQMPQENQQQVPQQQQQI